MTTTSKVELAFATYDVATQSWTAVDWLTNNNVLDHSFVLDANSDEQAMVIWRSNSDGLIFGTSSFPDTINYAIWSGAAWSVTGTLAANIDGILTMDVAYHNNNTATAVISRDTDGDLATSGDIELFYSEWDGTSWTALSQLTNNAVADESPAVMYTANGEKRLVWLQNSQLRLLNNDWSAAPVATTIENNSAGLKDMTAGIDNNDNLLLVWQGVSESGSDLFYAVYDEVDQTWSLESQLTSSSEVENSPSIDFKSDGQLLGTYVRDNISDETLVISSTLTITGVTTYQSSDLYILSYTPDYDLALTELSIPTYYINPSPGDTIELTAVVQNSGDWAINNPAVSFYDGDPLNAGILITTVSAISGTLASGETADVSVSWTIPSTTDQPHQIYAVVDPSNSIVEIDEGNNEQTLTAVLPELSVSSVKTYYYDQHQVVPLAIIANNGAITATNVLVEFRASTITGTVQYSQVITEIAPSEIKAITTTWHVSSWDIGLHDYYVVVDSQEAILEGDETDNSDKFSVSVLPDLVIYAGDIEADLAPLVGGPVTVTVRNWGTAVVTNAVVTLYEGPNLSIEDGTALYTWTVPLLDVDATMTLSTTIDHLPNRLFAVADPAQQIDEIDELNNIALTTQPISITFRYHDVELNLPLSATVTISGDWATEPITLTQSGNIYEATVSTDQPLMTYRYVVDGDASLLNSAERTVTVTVGTVLDDYFSGSVAAPEAHLFTASSQHRFDSYWRKPDIYKKKFELFYS